jgi:hypothetical protein
VSEPHGAVPGRRLAGVAAIAFSSVAWWPAFTLGAWGTVFFPQVLSLWAVTTAAFVLVVLSKDTRGRVGWWALALLLPSLWLALAIEFAPGSRPELAWLGTVVTLLGAPVMVWILIRFASPELVEDAEPRDRLVVVAAVLVVVLGAYGVGTIQERVFTCEDFTISGNSQPPGCTPGAPSLDIAQR